MVGEARKYRIIEALGKGGFGTVYSAELIGSGGFRKPVALKILNADVAGAEEIVSRLRDEARMLGLLRHPGIVLADALLQLDGRWTLVMEHVPGVGLNEIIAAGTLPLRAAVEVVGRVADALNAAHTATNDGRPLNLVHRDLKPGNIMVGTSGEVKLLDFGVARAEFESRESKTRSMIFGSPDYMAPERWEFTDLPASDVFSLGQVLYEVLTGEPFGRASPSREKYERKLLAAMTALSPPEEPGATADSDGYEHPTRGMVHPALLELLGTMLAFDPQARPTARQVESFCRDLAPRLPGAWLRDWAEHEMPRLLAARAPRGEDPLSGAVLTEPSGMMDVVSGQVYVTPSGQVSTRATLVPTPSGQFDPPGRAAPRPLRTLILVSAGLAGLLALILGSVWFLRHEPAPLTPRDGSGQTAELASILAPAEDQVPTPPSLDASPPAPERVSVPPAAPSATARPTKPATKSQADPTPPATAPTAQAAPATGRVSVKGGAEKVTLIRGAERHAVGEVPAGSYTIEARFPGRGIVTAGKVTVTAGQAVTLTCDASFALCRSGP